MTTVTGTTATENTITKQQLTGEIGQIALTVANVNQALQFYRDKLGLPFLFQPSEQLAFVQAGNTRIMLTTPQGEGKVGCNSVLYFTVDDIDTRYAELLAKGVTAERRPALAVTMPDHELWLGFIRDPEANLIGLMEEKPLVQQSERQVKTLHFGIDIQAPVQTVWQRMFSDVGYRNWTSAFCEGSYFKGSWQQGETIRFLSPSGDGMVSHIAEHKPLQFMSIKHLGFIVDGKDDFTSDKVLSWAPAFENYRFSENGGGTRLEVEQEVAPEYEQYMQDSWPKALQKLKALCEQN
ncbi:MAG: VOC family protein [Chromatiaceae bacterium]|nr:VOC family protein [Chromatiaceae bacterium]